MKNIAKYITLAILVVAFVIGCLGPWFKVFDMGKYDTFLSAYTPLYVTLITSIGAHKIVETIQNNKKE